MTSPSPGPIEQLSAVFGASRALSMLRAADQAHDQLAAAAGHGPQPGDAASQGRRFSYLAAELLAGIRVLGLQGFLPSDDVDAPMADRIAAAEQRGRDSVTGRAPDGRWHYMLQYRSGPSDVGSTYVQLDHPITTNVAWQNVRRQLAATLSAPADSVVITGLTPLPGGAG